MNEFLSQFEIYEVVITIIVLLAVAFSAVLNAKQDEEDNA